MLLADPAIILVQLTPIPVTKTAMIIIEGLLKLLLKNNPSIDTGLKLLKCKHNKEKDNLTIQFKNVNKLQFGLLYKAIFFSLFKINNFNTFSNHKIFISKAKVETGEFIMLHS